MKKKIIIVAIIVLLLLSCGIGIYWWKNRVLSTITLDINPSIELGLNRNNKVVKVKALNADAKKIVNNNIKGKNLTDSIAIITNNLISEGYTDENNVTILVYATGNVDNKKVEQLLLNNFEENHITTNIIAIDNISKEDKELAKKNNISVAKASYINAIIEDTNINTNNLINKSVDDLTETKNSGLYCDDGYDLEGGWCLKEISRVNATKGMVCPNGYYEYNDKCYEETGVIETDKLICESVFELKGKNCVRILTMDATPSKYNCSKGEAKTRLELGLSSANDGDANGVVCVDLSNATHPVSPCELPASDPTERKMIGGKCYWHRAPVIAAGCPGKIKVGGECWDDASNVLICAGYRDGKQYKSRDEYCEHSIKYYNPTVTEYKCESDYTLNGNKCEKEESQPAQNERICPTGYTKTNNDRCINLDKILPKENGYVCNQEHSKLRNNICVIYEEKEAKHS